ncbi:MAG: M20 metallopeptidase family protein [Deltaproteobacteria bacterium]
MEIFRDEARNLFNLMVEIRRDMHAHPEVDRNLTYTAALVEKHLKENGITYKRFPNNGIIADIGTEKNKIIALRADMDALTVQDMKTVPYKSTVPGMMHACGHDAHTAILIAAGIILKKAESQLNGTVRLIFQPAEETDGGAQDMIEYGCLENVEAVIGLHVDEAINTGEVALKKGLVCAASNPFNIKVTGKGSHGASPQDGVDAIVTSAKIVENLQTVVSRETSPVKNAVITIGTINGGTALNAISSSVEMTGILRTVGDDLRNFCKERMTSIIEQTANMMRGTAEINFVDGYPSFENDSSLAEFFIELADSLNNVSLKEIDYPSMGVEDFAYYTKRVPGLYYKLGCRSEEKGIKNPAHGGYFDIDEECMIVGCMLQSMFAYKLLNRRSRNGN